MIGRSHPLSISTRHQLMLVACCGAMFFVNLGTTRLWDNDEAIFSRTACEMLERGDLVVPYFNGSMLPDKPPLMYWAMICGYKLLGDVELAARFWSAVCGIGSVLLTYHLGGILFSRAVGFWSALALASSLNFAVVARAATPDSELVFFSTLALLIVAAGMGRAWRDMEPGLRAPGWKTYVLAYTAMGVAVLVKGPVGVVLPTAVVGLFLLCSRTATPAATQASLRAGSRWASAIAGLRRAGQMLAPARVAATGWSMRPLTALLVVAAVAGPWYAWVGIRTEGRWLTQFFGVQNLGRFLTPMDHHSGSHFYYLAAIMGGFFPWSVFFLPSLVLLSRRIRRAHPWRRGYQFVCCWVAVYVGFFSLASTKLPSYVVPAYPALALIVGALVATWVRRPAIVHVNWMRTAWMMLGLAGAAALVAVPIASSRALSGARIGGLFGLAPILGAVGAAWFMHRGLARRAMHAMASSAIVLITVMLGFTAVRVDQHQNSQQLAADIHGHATAPAPAVACYQYYRPSFVFYLGQPVARFISARQTCDFFRSHRQNAFVVTAEDHYRMYAPDLPEGVVVLARHPQFLRPGNVLVLGWPGTPHPPAVSLSSTAGRGAGSPDR